MDTRLEGDIIDDGKERYVRVKLTTMQANAKSASDAAKLIQQLLKQNKAYKQLFDSLSKAVTLELPQEDVQSA